MATPLRSAAKCLRTDRLRLLDFHVPETGWNTFEASGNFDNRL
jgi:hypothetical protein